MELHILGPLQVVGDDGPALRAAEMETVLLSELGKQAFHELAGAGALLTVPEAVALANEALTHIDMSAGSLRSR
jgi:hypothetical protein